MRKGKKEIIYRKFKKERVEVLFDRPCFHPRTHVPSTQEIIGITITGNLVEYNISAFDLFGIALYRANSSKYHMKFVFLSSCTQEDKNKKKRKSPPLSGHI